MALATADFELGTLSADVLAANPGSATAWNDVQTNNAGNHVTYDNTHAYGTLAAKIDNTGNNTAGVIMGWTTGIGTLTDWYWRVYLYCTANPTSTYRVILDANSGTYPVYITSSGTVQSYDLGGLVFTTTTAIALNQWVRLEGHWINSATVGQVELKLFNSPDSSTATETKTSAANRNTAASTTALYFGLAAGGSSSGPIWLDNIVAGAASYPGPVGVQAPPFANVTITA